MSKAPLFDNPDSFNAKYVKLADLDGSGIADIVYLANDSFKIYFNQSGNSWSDVNNVQGLNPLPFPKIDYHTSINIIDLLAMERDVLCGHRRFPPIPEINCGILI